MTSAIERWALAETPDSFTTAYEPARERALPSNLLALLNPAGSQNTLGQCQSQVWSCSSTKSTKSKVMTPSIYIQQSRKRAREPSPLDLDDEQYIVDDAYSPNSHAIDEAADESYGSKRKPKTASKRRVSHSIIEKKRRGKINQCLSKLQHMIPSLRCAAKNKMARRGLPPKSTAAPRRLSSQKHEQSNYKDECFLADDVVDKNNNTTVELNKLDILMGSIAYIEQLEERILQLETVVASRNRVDDHCGLHPSMPLPETHAAGILVHLASPEMRPAFA